LENLDADGIIIWTDSSGLSHVLFICGNEFPVTQEAGNFLRNWRATCFSDKGCAAWSQLLGLT